MRRLKPVSLNVKNIGRDGKKTTVSIPLKVDFGRQPEKSTQENNKGIDSPEEQDVPLHDLENQPSTSQQQNRVLSTSGNWEKDGVFVPLYSDEATVGYGCSDFWMPQVSSIYSILNSECFEEFRYFMYQYRHCTKYNGNLYNGAWCPLCPRNCSKFHAGEVLSALRSKGKNKLFDEKGVFGRVCRPTFLKDSIT